jgi:hypothetical protein
MAGVVFFKLSASRGRFLAYKRNGAQQLFDTFAIRPARHFRLTGKCYLYAEKHHADKNASDPNSDEPVTRVALHIAVEERTHGQGHNGYHRSLLWYASLPERGTQIARHRVCKTPQHKMPQHITN